MDTTTLTATSAEALTATATATATATVTATAAAAPEAASLSSTSPTLASNLQLCRICISSNVNCTQMISLFGEDALWRKITTLADVKIERGDILPQQVCLTCAKNIISAYLFKKKCEDADSFYRQQLFLPKTVSQNNGAESDGEDEFNNGTTNGQDDVSSHSYKHHHHPVNGCEGNDDADDDDEEEEDDHELSSQMIGHQFKPDPEDDERRENDVDDDEEDDEEQQQLHIDDSGEVKCLNNGLKPAFDFNSIRLMHEYMQQHLSKFNGLQSNHATAASDEEAAGGDGSVSDTDQDDDDDGPLPLIPEIELITPSEVCDSGNNGNGNTASMDGQGITQMRGYQCPHCYQIFEMKQVLKAHMQSVHGAAGPVYECTNCKKTYFYKRFLEKHIRRGRCVKKRRNQTRPMQCSDCNVLFPTGHHLGWHKRTGCPSKTAKMPLQQLFKQNIVQYNNFPRRGGGRKPENALYLHNRKLVMANNKRKGRTRIKLDARKIALAKQLILREATTTVIANELNISRTFAWRLRKSLVNGISLHERVIDPTEEEDDDGGANYTNDEVVENVVQRTENLLNHHPFTEHFIKSENLASEDEEVEQPGQNDSEADFNQQREQHEKQQQQYHQPQQPDDEEDNDDHEYLQQMQLQKQLKQHDNAVATSVIQRATTAASNEHMIAVQLQQQHQAIEQKLHNISVVQQQRLMELQPNNNTRTPHHQQQDASPPGGKSNHNNASDEENQMTADDFRIQQQQMQQQQQQQQRETDPNTKCGVNSQEYTKNNFVKNVKSPLVHNGKLPLITQLSPAIAAAIHQLPVNLSIRPIASMQNNESSPANSSNNTTTNINRTTNSNSSKKKPRKPNVFIDDEKYAMAKMLVAQNASTMEIAKALNVSQMTAWKLRDAIIKGVPLSYRNKKDIRMTAIRPEEEASGSCGAVSEGSEGKRETDSERQQQALLVKQQLEHQQKLQQQHIQQQQQIQQLLQRQQQLQQQQLQLEQQKIKQQRELEEEEEQRQLLVQQQQQQQQLQQQQQQQQQQRQQQLQPKQEQKHLNPRRRLKAAERELRDKEITREILELIREDNNIQYWKVSARLAEKGYAISPSSVCQKLKSMGIHRRWKPGDKPPLIDMEHLKATNTNNSVAGATTSLNLSQAANSSLAAATLAANAASSTVDESYEQQFDMGGAHFLSAFTR